MINSPLANVKLELVDSIDQAMALKRWLGDRRRDALGVDTESSGLKPERDVLRLIQVGDLETGWAIPWDRWGGVAMEILNSYTGPLVLHNSSFDMRFLQTHAGYVPPWERIHDTMTMAHLIDPARPKGLKPLADRLVDPRATAGQALLNKAMSDNDWSWATVPVDNPYYWVYGALDPVLTCHVREKLWPQIVGVGSERAYDLEMGAVRVCANMMLRGVRIDKAYCVRKAASLRDWSAQARKWLKDSYGISNATSNAQILKCLQNEGIEFTKLTPKGAYAIDKEVLDAIDHPVADYVTAIRRAEKICSSYLDNLISLADHNDVVHCNINPLGARTGRMSITDPALQTLHRTDPTVRNAFIPSEGNQIIACDADQIEARLASHFSGDLGMQEAFLSPDDFFCIVASEIFGEPIIKGDPRRQTTKNVVYGCVPLDTEIFTRHGWLRYHEVEVGDETLGLDQENDQLIWTTVTDVHYYDDADLVQFGNRHWSVRTTPNHRWPSVRRTGEWSDARYEHLFVTSETTTPDDRITLSAPYAGTDVNLNITAREAAILGWTFTDGKFAVQRYVGAPSQSHGDKCGVTMMINQSVKKYTDEIDELLDGVPHRRTSDGEYVTWSIAFDWARNLAQRAKIYDHEPDLLTLATSLTSRQRLAMRDAMIKADGNPLKKTKRHVIDLFVLLSFLEGYRVKTVIQHPDGVGWQRKPIWVVRPQNGAMTGQRTAVTPIEPGPVWCVTTTAGTWTMRQDDKVMVTGNSIYGAGVRTMARTAKVTYEQMEPVKRAFDLRFPGLNQLMQRITSVAHQRLIDEGAAYVTTPLGRRVPSMDQREYALVNYLIQSHAAEVLKKGLVDLDAAGLGPNMVFPVHDEIVADVPAVDVIEVKHLIEYTLNDPDTYAVPLTWSADIFEERWAPK